MDPGAARCRSGWMPFVVTVEGADRPRPDEEDRMRKVVLYTLMSLDGMVDEPDRYFPDFDEVMYANLAAVIEAQDTVLLGRRMYDEWASYWPGSDHQPFAGFVNGVEKYVVTSSPLTTAWSGSSAWAGPLDELVHDLRARPGGDIGVHGSIGLAQSLLGLGLVDELRLVVGPTVAGTGRRLFADLPAPGRLELLRAVATPSGSVLLDYRRPA